MTELKRYYTKNLYETQYPEDQEIVYLCSDVDPVIAELRAAMLEAAECLEFLPPDKSYGTGADMLIPKLRKLAGGG